MDFYQLLNKDTIEELKWDFIHNVPEGEEGITCDKFVYILYKHCSKDFLTTTKQSRKANNTLSHTEELDIGSYSLSPFNQSKSQSQKSLKFDETFLRTLIEMFDIIDLDRSGQVSWQELLDFCVEAAAWANKLRFCSFDYEYKVNEDFVDNVSGYHQVRYIRYIPQLKKLLVVPQKKLCLKVISESFHPHEALEIYPGKIMATKSKANKSFATTSTFTSIDDRIKSGGEANSATKQAMIENLNRSAQGKIKKKNQIDVSFATPNPEQIIQVENTPWVLNAIYIPTLRQFAVTTLDNYISFWDYDTLNDRMDVSSRILFETSFPGLHWCEKLEKLLCWTEDKGDFYIYVWNVFTKRLKYRLAGHQSTITCALEVISLSSMIVTGDLDGKIYVWIVPKSAARSADSSSNPSSQNYAKNPKNNKNALMPVLDRIYGDKCHQYGVRELVYSAEHDVVISVGYDIVAFVWNLTSKVLQAQLIGHHFPLVSVKIVKHELERAVTCDTEGSFRIWSIEKEVGNKGICLQTFDAHGPARPFHPYAFDIAWNNNIIAGSSGLKVIFNTTHKKVEDPFRLIYNNIKDELMIIQASSLVSLKMQNGKVAKTVNPIRMGKQCDVTAVDCDQTFSRLLLGDSIGDIGVHRYANLTRISQPLESKHFAPLNRSAVKAKYTGNGFTGEIINIHFDQPNDLGVAITTNRDIFVFDLSINETNYDDEDGQTLGEMELVKVMHNAHDRLITSTAFSSNLSLVATASQDGSLRVFDYESLTLISAYVHLKADIICMQFLDPFPILLTSDTEGNITGWFVRPYKRPGHEYSLELSKCFEFTNYSEPELSFTDEDDNFDKATSSSSRSVNDDDHEDDNTSRNNKIINSITCISIEDKAYEPNKINQMTEYNVVTGDTSGYLKVWNFLPIFQKIPNFNSVCCITGVAYNAKRKVEREDCFGGLFGGGLIAMKTLLQKPHFDLHELIPLIDLDSSYQEEDQKQDQRQIETVEQDMVANKGKGENDITNEGAKKVKESVDSSSLRDQICTASWRAHKTSITCIEIIKQHKLIASGSLERVVKLWKEDGEDESLAYIKEFVDGSISKVIYWDIQTGDLSTEIEFRKSSVENAMKYIEEKVYLQMTEEENNSLPEIVDSSHFHNHSHKSITKDESNGLESIVTIRNEEEDEISLSSLDSEFLGTKKSNFNAIDLLIIILRRRYKRQLNINRTKRWLIHRSSSLISANSMSNLGKTFALQRCQNPIERYQNHSGEKNRKQVGQTGDRKLYEELNEMIREFSFKYAKSIPKQRKVNGNNRRPKSATLSRKKIAVNESGMTKIKEEDPHVNLHSKEAMIMNMKNNNNNNNNNNDTLSSPHSKSAHKLKLMERRTRQLIGIEKIVALTDDALKVNVDNIYKQTKIDAQKRSKEIEKKEEKDEEEEERKTGEWIRSRNQEENDEAEKGEEEEEQTQIKLGQLKLSRYKLCMERYDEETRDIRNREDNVEARRRAIIREKMQREASKNLQAAGGNKIGKRGATESLLRSDKLQSRMLRKLRDQFNRARDATKNLDIRTWPRLGSYNIKDVFQFIIFFEHFDDRATENGELFISSILDSQSFNHSRGEFLEIFQVLGINPHLSVQNISDGNFIKRLDLHTALCKIFVNAKPPEIGRIWNIIRVSVFIQRLFFISANTDVTSLIVNMKGKNAIKDMKKKSPIKKEETPSPQNNPSPQNKAEKEKRKVKPLQKTSSHYRLNHSKRKMTKSDEDKLSALIREMMKGQCGTITIFEILELCIFRGVFADFPFPMIDKLLKHINLSEKKIEKELGPKELFRTMQYLLRNK